jgi:hypothetical protein
LSIVAIPQPGGTHHVFKACFVSSPHWEDAPDSLTSSNIFPIKVGDIAASHDPAAFGGVRDYSSNV